MTFRGTVPGGMAATNNPPTDPSRGGSAIHHSEAVEGSRAGLSGCLLHPGATVDSTLTAPRLGSFNQGHTDDQLAFSAAACFYSGLGFVAVLILALLFG